MKSNHIGAVIGAAAVLLITAGLVDVAAHLAVDEVAEHGDAGYGGGQLSHEHPHNRTVFYAHANGTIWGSPVDVYETELRTAAQEDAAEDVPEVIIFSFSYGTVTCAEGEGHERVMTRYVHGPHEEFHWSSAHNEATSLWMYEFARSGNGAQISAFWADVDEATDTYHVIATVWDEGGHMCDDPPHAFIADIRGDCGGDSISITSRNAAAYNVTASGDSVHAACIP